MRGEEDEKAEKRADGGEEGWEQGTDRENIVWPRAQGKKVVSQIVTSVLAFHSCRIRDVDSPESARMGGTGLGGAVTYRAVR